MRTRTRVFLLIAAILALIPLIGMCLYYLGKFPVDNFVTHLSRDLNLLQQIIGLALALILLALLVFIILYAIFGERLKKQSAKQNELGVIDIGVTAIENIALNAAKAAQAGIKSAKAKVFAAEEEKISVELSVILYSDVEIPLQMTRIQERVKKDIEKYTGIGVQDVTVKVKRVELLGAQVER